MQFLASIPKDVVRAKQKAIEKYATIMQYSIPPVEGVGNCLGHAGSPGQERGCVWNPPTPDVADVMLLGLSSIIRRFFMCNYKFYFLFSSRTSLYYYDFINILFSISDSPELLY